MTDEVQYPDCNSVPPPPETALWDDLLRWCVFVMNKGDPQRHFAASCLAWTLKSGGLTERQAAACSKMLRRITDLYDAGALDCQFENEESEPDHSAIRRDLH